MSTTRRRSSRSWMQGISRMRLPMSAKLPAICAILSANGLGMKCVHASTRIMGESSDPFDQVAASAGLAFWRRGLGFVEGARGMAAPRLSSPRALVARRSRARSGGIEAVAHAHELHGDLFELLGALAARAHQALMHGPFLVLH